MKEGILLALPESSRRCIEHAKVELLKTKRESVYSADLLEISHTDICEPFLIGTRNIYTVFHSLMTCPGLLMYFYLLINPMNLMFKIYKWNLNIS